ncbi:hypothetical protein CCH79_00015397 [Gambusia affinis]|uniref:VWFD domain-containing protein n=1 Tax=Gambusia affinis TaxID=33528 RepID=A0A315VHC8_GAMAF|nr:hypothetical protein CCH79_00015397 [Gambusia affinis]
MKRSDCHKVVWVVVVRQTQQTQMRDLEICVYVVSCLCLPLRMEEAVLSRSLDPHVKQLPRWNWLTIQGPTFLLVSPENCMGGANRIHSGLPVWAGNSSLFIKELHCLHPVTQLDSPAQPGCRHSIENIPGMGAGRVSSLPSTPTVEGVEEAAVLTPGRADVEDPESWMLTVAKAHPWRPNVCTLPCHRVEYSTQQYLPYSLPSCPGRTMTVLLDAREGSSSKKLKGRRKKPTALPALNASWEQNHFEEEQKVHYLVDYVFIVADVVLKGHCRLPGVILSEDTAAGGFTVPVARSDFMRPWVRKRSHNVLCDVRWVLVPKLDDHSSLAGGFGLTASFTSSICQFHLWNAVQVGSDGFHLRHGEVGKHWGTVLRLRCHSSIGAPIVLVGVKSEALRSQVQCPIPVFPAVTLTLASNGSWLKCHCTSHGSPPHSKPPRVQLGHISLLESNIVKMNWEPGLVVLLGLQLVVGAGHWCERVVEDRVEWVQSPRLQLEVGCSEVYQYNTQGWRLDVDRMRTAHGGDDGIAQYYKQQGQTASCFLYKPPEIESHTVNKTVRTCCEGWGGPHCSQGVEARGQCYSTWNCEKFPGVHNSSLMPMEQCCSTLWGLSWKNASDQTCLTCTYTLLPDSQSSPLVRSGLLGTARVPLGSATCMSWGGAHYRTFDRKHFHFQGSCTYLLASSTDGTWAVYISTICDQRGDCNKVIIPYQTNPVVEDVLHVGTKHIFGRHTNNQISVRISFQALRMMLGLDLVSIHHKNVTLNSLSVPNGEPLFQNGVSVYWLGDYVFVESGVGVRVKFDMVNTVYVTVTSEQLGTTRGLCGVFNNDPDDDFTTMAGAVSSYAASFGNSWKIPDQHSEDCSDAAELGHSCDVTGDPALRRRAEAVCGLLLEKPFTHCHSQVDPGAYMDACQYLYCSLPPKERQDAVCDTLASYTRECAEQHVVIMWRTAALCGRVCPRGQVFSDCVSSCPPSCSSPRPPGPAAAVGQCREKCVGGCECPPDRYLYQGLCLNREDCPCFHRRRIYQPGDRIQMRCNTW